MQKQELIHNIVLQKSQELKSKINIKDFCKLHGVSESKISRFPSKKLIQELVIFDYMQQFADNYNNIRVFLYPK